MENAETREREREDGLAAFEFGLYIEIREHRIFNFCSTFCFESIEQLLIR